MSESNLAYSTILEIGEVSGQKNVSNSVQIGSETTQVYNGCEESTRPDQMYNPHSNEPNVRVVGYSGNYIGYWTGIGSLSSGCSQTQIKIELPNGIEYQPLNNSKLIMIDFQSQGTFWRQEPHTFNTKHFRPRNTIFYTKDDDWNVQGRTLYVKSFNHLNELVTLCFDVVDAYGSFLICKGNGGDHVSDYMQLNRNWYNNNIANGNQGNLDWYISAYVHSGLWDSSGGQVTWDNTRKSVGMSYMNDKMFSGNQQNLVQNEVYTNEGYFGVRNSYFREAIINSGSYDDPDAWRNRDHDVWELKVDVASINNAKIQIFEGTPNNPIYSSGLNSMSEITEPGLYTFCLAALPFSDRYKGKHINGGFTLADTGMENAHSIDHQAFIDMMDAQLTLLNAITLDENLAASITINKIELRKADPKLVNVTTPIMGSTFNYNIDQYEWKFLDILDSEKVPLALNFSVGDISNISKRTSGYSKTFMIPASPNNNEVLDPMLSVNSQKQKIGWERGRIKTNGVVVFEGLMRIEEGNTGNGGFYKCHILEDTIDWSQEIADTKLCDLILNETTQPKRDYLNVLYSWVFSKPYGGVVEPITGFTLPPDPQGWFWGLANYGEWYYKSLSLTNAGEFDHGVKDFHPVVFTKSILIAIFKSIGYSVESKFMDTMTFNLLCHPFSSGEDYELGGNTFGEDGDYYAKAEDSGRRRADEILGWSNFKSGGYVPPRGYDRTWYPSLIIQSDTGNNFTGSPSNKAFGSSSKGYVVPFPGDYRVVCKGIIDVSFCAGGNGGFVNVYVENNGTGNGFHANGGNQAPSIADHGDHPFYTAWTSFGCSAGDVISFKIVAETLMTGLCKYWVAAKELEMLIYPVPSGGAPSIDVNKQKFLPCDTKQIDFIAGLTDLFNLQWTADSKNKIVYFEPYNDFFGSGDVKDWTEKLDNTRWNDKFIVEELAKEVTFSYKRTSTDKGMTGLDAWRESNGYGEYKTHIEINDEKFRKEEVNIATDKFAPIWRFNNYGTQPTPHQNSNNQYNWGDLSWANPNVNKALPLMPVIWTEAGGHINKGNGHRPPYKAFPKMKLQIVNYYSLLNGVHQDGSNPNIASGTMGLAINKCSKYAFKDDAGLRNDLEFYPYMDWIDGWKKGIESDPYCLSWNDYNDGHNNISPGLFEKYWRVAYEKMNGGSVLRTAFINLTALDIANFDYRDLIHLTIDNVSTYWTVNKIIDYNPNKNVLTKVELLEWKQAVDFATRRNQSESTMDETQERRLQQEDTVIKKTNNDGVTIENNSGNIASGTGVALGRGVVANNNQTVLGSFNDPNSTDIFQVGSGTSEDDRRTAFSISSQGEIKIGGGEIYVEEEDGTIHDLIVKKTTTTRTLDGGYGNSDNNHNENSETDIDKLYLTKPKEYKLEEHNGYQKTKKKTEQEYKDVIKKKNN